MANPTHYLRPLSAKAVDSDPSLLLEFESAKYFFNVPEGLQRIASANTVKFGKTKAVFLTSLDWESAGGLPGLLFTIADRIGASELSIVGPENIRHLVASWRSFFMRWDLSIKFTEVPVLTDLDLDTPVYQDKMITVYAISLDSQLPLSPRPSPTALGKHPRSPSPSPSNKKPLLTTSLTEPLSRLDASALSNPFASSSSSTDTNTAPPSNLEPLPTSATPPLSPHQADLLELAEQRMFHTPAGVKRSTLPISALSKLMPNTRHRSHACYIITGPGKRGKFDGKLADDLEVPRHVRGFLTQGKPVTVPGKDGKPDRVVTPEEVLGPSTPPTTSLVIDCPNTVTIQQLVANPIWKRYQSPDEKGFWPVHVIWHKQGTWSNSQEYQTWMNSFGPEVQHFTGDPGLRGNYPVHTLSALHSRKLSLIDPKMFPSQHYEIIDKSADLPPSHNPLNFSTIVKAIPRSPFIQVPCKPSITLPNLALSDDAFRAWLANEEPGGAEFLAVAEEIQKEVQAEGEKRQKEMEEGQKKKEPGDDIVVSPLGTGSSMPSTYRNVSSTHIEVPGWGGILLDCGEGTFGQLSRLFGSEKLLDVMRDVKLVFISHMHADHHLGLVRFLQMRKQLLKDAPRLTIVCPYPIRQQLIEASAYQPLDMGKINFVFSNKLLSSGSSFPDHARLCSDIGLSKVEAVKVAHRGHDCYGIVIEHADGWKIVYSGDTMPCKALVEAGTDATLLIHEATIEDDTPAHLAELEEFNKTALPAARKLSYAELAASKGHSTFAQAVQVGRSMKAKHVLLNHFSQRYPKGVHFDLKTIDPTSPPDVQANAAVQVIGLALDLIRVPIGEMWKLRAYYPAVSMLNDDGVEEEGGEGEGGDDEGAGLLQEEGKEGKGGGKKEKPKKEKKEKVAKGGGGAQEGQGEKKQKKKKGGNGGGPAPLELASDLA